MNQEIKNNFLQKAKNHVASVRQQLVIAIEKIKVRIATKVHAAKLEDKWTNAHAKALNENRLEQLKEIETSPYFSKCEVTFDDTDGMKELYFGKFSFAEEKIYSWIAPAGSIRFESPGKFSYTLPNGLQRTGTLHSKDQYKIVDGNILFYSNESTTSPRELVYQEHFSQHKVGFILPEIVSQMEKAQDVVIRATYKGPFLISGPAGSGKTTLALHRIAYLMQSPETTALYPSYSILVLVQDESTKDYFSHLLPSLGINSVTITTFSEWAATIIGLEDCVYDSQFVEDDGYEYRKLQALRNNPIPRYSKNVFALLQKIYSSHFTEKDALVFSEQKNKKTLDRIDMTLLLLSYKHTFKKLSTVRNFYTLDARDELVARSSTTALEYSLIAVDEFQNYLPEQLTLFKQCILPDTESLMYIGDLQQQVRVGTIQEWKSIGEIIPERRQVLLQKVYRNTKEIIEYIQSKGYKVALPEGIKSGGPVIEKSNLAKEEISKHVTSLVQALAPQETLAVISMFEHEVEFLQSTLPKNTAVHFVTMRESQGLEFDKVCIITSGAKTQSEESTDPVYLQEQEKIQKDLLYVALTRAISELHVLSTT